MSIVVSAFMVFSLCSGKSVEFSRLASLAQVSSVKYDGFGNKTVACQYCNDFVKGLDEHGLRPEYNTSEKLSKGLQETCSQVAQGSPEAAFCRQLEGQFDVFAKAYFRHMEQSWVGPCFVSGVCYVKSVGFNNLAKLSKIFALSDETVACENCEKIVKSIDARGLQTEYNTPEKFAKGLEEICPHAVPDSPDAEFCKALNGKYDVFAKAYFQHMEHHEIDPCKVAGVCTAKFVGFNNLASLSQVFALSDETEACKDCKHFVAYADKLPQMPEDQNTPEKLAKDACADSRVPEEFCKALEGKFDVFAKAYFQHRDNHQVNPCKVAQLSQDFLSDERSVCEHCEGFVAYLDRHELSPDINTPEKLAKSIQLSFMLKKFQEICAQESPKELLCKDLEGKFDIFAVAYFQHRDDPKVDPCKEVQIC
ncbi:hypothetical protein Ddc_19166 [Ditylenchus destructor]|nr:hypothetical protein Ddc_19166 [Ditylenchus destructor]